MKKVYEIVRYKQKDDTKDQSVIKASNALQEVVASQDGLISRKLSKSNEGEWIDVVLWESMDHAIQAAKVVNSHPVAGQFMALIDDASLAFTHYEVMEEY